MPYSQVANMAWPRYCTTFILYWYCTFD